MWNECILWSPSQCSSQPFTPTAGPGTHLWERDKREKERGERDRERGDGVMFTSCLKLLTAQHHITFQHDTGAEVRRSRTNEALRLVFFFWSSDTMGTFLPGQQRWAWGLSSGQWPKRIQATNCASQRSCDLTHLWCLKSNIQRGSNHSNRLVEITTPRITVEVQLLSLYKYCEYYLCSRNFVQQNVTVISE